MGRAESALGRCRQASTHDWHAQINGIGERGAQELARALALNSSITHLNVAVRARRSGRGMGSGVKCMAAWYPFTNECVKGNGIGERGALEFARALEQNTSIKELNVSVCSCVMTAICEHSTCDLVQCHQRRWGTGDCTSIGAQYVHRASGSGSMLRNNEECMNR